MYDRIRRVTQKSHWMYLARWLGQTLSAGLGVLLPPVVTVYVLVWLLITAERLAGGAVKIVLPNDWNGGEPYYIPGLGTAVFAILLLVFGIALRTFNMQRILNWEDHRLRRIPLVRTLYGSIKDIGQYFTKTKDNQLGQPVLVTLPETSIQMLGFMTRTDGTSFEGYALVDDPVLVYLPMSYQIGGYLLVVPRSSVEPVQLPFDEAMSFVFMAGMKDIQVGLAGDGSRNSDAGTPRIREVKPDTVRTSTQPA